MYANANSINFAKEHQPAEELSGGLFYSGKQFGYLKSICLISRERKTAF
jgi:hypothetical protein